MSALKEQFEAEGFVVVDSGLPEETLIQARLADGPLQPKQYHWNPAGRRVFEGWRTSQAIRDCAYAPKIIRALVDVLGLEKSPRPFQTISFDRPSLQKLHQDAVHFDTWPKKGGLVGVWLALEDVDESNGSLAYVPKTHTLPSFRWQEDMGFSRQAVDKQYEAYADYETRMEKMGEFYGGKQPFRAKAGQAFLWGLNLLHGGWPAADPERTRYSLVTHYILPGADRLYAPMFSDPASGQIHWKAGRWFDRAGHQHPQERNT